MHVTRYVMYSRLARYRETAPGLALSISRSERLCGFLGFDAQHVVAADYPAYDLLALPFEDGQFDAVVADQVLEHVAGDPGRAMAETFRVLRPGGLAVLTSCCVNPIHHQNNYDDYWRFTPAGLRVLAERHGNVLEADGWGNPVVCVWVSVRRLQVPDGRWHPISWLGTWNHPAYPVVSWVVALKGGEGWKGPWEKGDDAS